ncbi:integrase family protein [Halosimplex carlsbadense 2-9-1]|uniref:Integrase family protein n=1 Tax=Halosimplex carlsbadense 2-9-1 TaxID=797114 RepID=M0CG36_9EURY|nr:tyrosine-type recombinase/integrase [Halosimplex carlsbadense]ELZ21583.1 integrase family protein [Halosimplex carlsbadense 2-9-1]
MNVDDPSGNDKKLPRQEDLLDEAHIAPVDKQSIKDFLVHMKSDGDIERHTMADRIRDLRLTSERADMPLTRMGHLDWDRFVVEELEENRGLSEGTIDNYKSAARKYFRWLDRSWYEEISFATADEKGKDLDPEDLFTRNEIDAMLEQGDARGKAVTALYAALGWRASAIASILTGDTDLEGETATVTLNEDAYTKGAEGTSPLTFARGYVASYLRGDHPCPERDDVPLIHKKQQYEDGDRALSTDRIRGIVKDMAEEAGIDRDRANLHNFRHTAVTRWRLQGIPDHRIQKRVKWAEGTDMFDIYDNPEEDKEVQSQAIAFGANDPGDFEDEEGGTEPGDGLGECSVCGETVRVNARYCQTCGNPLDVEAAQNVPPEDIQDPEETAEDLADMDGVLDEMSTATVIERLLQENPDLLDSLDFDLGD